MREARLSTGEGIDWLRSGRFAALLATLLGATFPQVLAGLESFTYFDGGQFAYPVALYHREAFWRGEVPLWNPLNSCGIPFLAQWNTMTLYPPALFYLLLPWAWSFGVFGLAHLFLAGLGMYTLAWRWTGQRLAAAVAGAVFAFNGLTWHALIWPSILGALAWMPWVVWSVERACRDGGRWVLLAAVAGALQLLTGGVEVILLTWLAVGAWWLVEVGARALALGRSVGRLLCAGGLAAGLAAAQLLPFLELLAHSQRSSVYSAGGMGGIAAMPLSGWANFLVPLFGCVRNAQGVWVQAGQSWTASYYLGAGTIALALVAVWRVRDRRVRLLTALTVFALVMAWGRRGLVYEWATAVLPVLGFIRFPVKFVALATFALPLLAAAGVAWLLGGASANWPRERRRLIGLVAGLGLCAGVLVALAWKHPTAASSLGATLTSALTRQVFLLGIVGAVVWLRQRSGERARRLVQLGLIVLLWLDVFTHSSNLSPTAPRTALAPDTIREYFGWTNALQLGSTRAWQSPDSLWRLAAAGAPEPETDLYQRRLALFLNCNLLDHVPKFDGFYSLDVKEFLDLFQHVYFRPKAAEGWKDFLAISHTSDPADPLGWVRREGALPLLTAGRRPVFADEAMILQRVLGEDFDPRREVYLPSAAQAAAQATREAPAQVSVQEFRAHRVRARVRADAAVWVTVAQTFYPAWRAYVDGRPVRLWRANYAFQALEVPAGDHEVTLAYEDRAFWAGAVLSLLSLLGGGVTWFRLRAGESAARLELAARPGPPDAPAAAR